MNRSRLLAVLLGAAAVLLIAGLAFLGSTRRSAETGSGYFSGQLPGGSPAFLRWEVSRDEVSGEIRSLAEVEAREFTGTNTPHGVVGEVFRWGATGHLNEVRFQLQPTEAARELRGYWLPAGKTIASPVRFERIAELATRTQKTGLRFRDRGRMRVATATWPKFPGDHPFARQVNRWLADESGTVLTDFAHWNWEEMKDGWEFPDSLGAFYTELHWDIIWHADRLISLLGSEYAYEGGAHGNYMLRSANFVDDGQGAREFSFSELFRSETPWRAAVSQLVWQELRRQQASSISEEPPDADEFSHFSTFTLNPAGAQVYFAPYEVASFAEGSFTVHLPWTKLLAFTHTNGIVRLRASVISPKLPRSDP
jgi:hypothetical protein